MSIFVIIIITLIFSAFFSGIEIAFVSANLLRFEMERKQGVFPSGIVNIFMKSPSHFIATTLIGNNVALVIYGIFMAIVLDPYINMFVTSGVWVLIIQTLLSTFLILIAAEFIPKALFRINPNFLLNVFALPVFIFYILFYPITKLSIWISNFILRFGLRVDISEKKSEMVFGKIDLGNLINEVNAELEQSSDMEHEIRIFQNALDFSDIKLRECMIPRTEIIALPLETSIEELTDKFIETGLSKILIYKDTNDNIIGYFNSSDLFKSPKTIKSKLMPILIVPESMPANKLLELFMKEHKHITVVVDEFGGTSGMLTIEDIIEEIFGEIEDEHDKIELAEKKVSEKEFIFSGRLEIDYLNEKYNLGIEESEDYNTLAGYIFHNLENIPKQNELIRIDDFEIVIIKVSNTRIDLLNIKLKE